MSVFILRLIRVAAIAMAASANAEPLQLYSGLAPPVSYISPEDSQPKGMAVDMVRELIACTGDETVMSAHPWSRAVRFLDSTPNSGLFVTDRTPERETRYHWVGPIYHSMFSFYALKSSNLKIDHFEQLKNAGTIAVPLGWQAVKRAREQGLQNLLLVNDTSQLLFMLKQHRVNIIGLDELMLHSMAYGDLQLERLVAFTPVNGYLAFNSAVPLSTVKRWQSCFDTMRRNATYQRIYLHWIGQLPPKD